MLEKNNMATFLSIGDGKITKRVKTPTTESVTRTTKEGKVVNEEIYDAVAGFITDIKVSTHPQYGKFWNVSVIDGDSNFVLQMNYSGGYSSAFLKLLPNVDLQNSVRIIPTMKIVEGKKKVGLFITQNGEPLKHFFTKDNPNGLPQMKKVKIKGEMKWDDSDMMEFLENMVKNDIVPKLKSKKVAAPVTPDGEEEDGEGMPF